MSLFDNNQESNLKACVEMVEACLAEAGLDPARLRLAGDGGPSWGFTRGSADVFVYLSTTEDGSNYIQVVAPVMRPLDEKRPVLYAHLLELNANELTGAAFGLRSGDVVLSTDRSTIGLDKVEVEEMIRRIGAYADHYDDALTAEYGGKRHSDL